VRRDVRSEEHFSGVEMSGEVRRDVRSEEHISGVENSGEEEGCQE
jgi:hypothetical protein